MTNKGTTHTINLHLSVSERGFIEYTNDENKDMFQFGRASQNDFVVTGYVLNGGSTMSR
jgi:hypothetical protein